MADTGFKRVWADTTMPLLTNFAEYLKDGWPIAVNVFRYTVAQIATLLLGLDEAVYVSTKSIIAGLTSMGLAMLANRQKIAIATASRSLQG